MILSGYKTYIGGISFILSGVSSLGIAWFEGTEMPFVQAWSLISIGISVIGGRAAFEKKQ